MQSKNDGQLVVDLSPEQFQRLIKENIGATKALQLATAQRKETEEALRDSEESYRTLLNSIDDGFCVIEVLFDDAQIDFSDESLILPFRTDIDSTRGAIRDVASFGGTPGSLELEGKVGQYGLARASGTLMINDPFAATVIKADFRNVDMVALTPYSAQFAGYSIKEGKLDLDLNYKIQSRQLQADHHIVATDLQLGDKVEGGESPGFLVKLAISLMKDREGKIKLDVPVEGTVDDPEFSYKGIVWKAIKQILGKM